jgi:hypothetical protein
LNDVQHPWDVSDDGGDKLAGVRADETGPDYTEGEARILEEIERVSVKVDAMLEVFGQLAVMLDQLKGKSLIDVLRGK